MVLTHLIFFRFFTGAAGAAAVPVLPTPDPVQTGAGSGAGTTQRFGQGEPTRRELRAKQTAPGRRPVRPDEREVEVPQPKEVLTAVAEARALGQQSGTEVARAAAEIAHLKARIRISQNEVAIRGLEAEITAIEERLQMIRRQDDELVLLLLQ